MVLALSPLIGCGAESEDLGPAVEVPSLDPAPLARLAFERPVTEIDPLYARSRSERLLSRQVFEPLSVAARAPLGLAGRRRGPARILGPSGSLTLWRFELRPGLRFADGASLNADAVLTNVDRWIASGLAERRLPQLIAADSPRPGLIRIQLSEPVADLPERLSRSGFGLVSPRAIAARGTRPVRRGDAGAGPFELREREATRLLLVRNAQWWGFRQGLGPGVERLEFLVVPSDRGRADQLRIGVVDVADELGPTAAATVAADPLLGLLGSGELRIGISAAVRGLSGTATSQSLSSLWLTGLS